MDVLQVLAAVLAPKDEVARTCHVGRGHERADEAGGEHEVEPVAVLRDELKPEFRNGVKTDQVFWVGWLVVAGSLLAIAWAWWQSKRVSAEMRQMDEEFSREASGLVPGS